MIKANDAIPKYPTIRYDIDLTQRHIRKFGINTCVVSTSPRPYVERVV